MRSLTAPLLVLAAALAYLLRPPPQSSLDEGTLFEDESTGGCGWGLLPCVDRDAGVEMKKLSGVDRNKGWPAPRPPHDKHAVSCCSSLAASRSPARPTCRHHL